MEFNFADLFADRERKRFAMHSRHLTSPKRMPPSCLPAHCFGRATSGTYLPWLAAALKLGPLHCYGAPAGWPPFRTASSSLDNRS